MKKLMFMVVVATLLANTSFSQSWTYKSMINDSTKACAYSFQINNKLYVGGGLTRYTNIQSSFWEYDFTLDTWTSKSGLGLLARAVSFNINGKGYVLGGSNGTSNVNALHEYDPLTNTWSAKSPFPLSSITNGFAFVINNKAYCGSYTNFYEYDPLNDIWTQKTNIPVQINKQAFSANNKGYVISDGWGNGTGQVVSKVYEYDVSLNTWTQKNDAPFRLHNSTTTSNGTEGILIGGDNGDACCNPIYVTPVKKYYPATDTWTTIVQGPYYTGDGVATVYNNSLYYGFGYIQNTTGTYPYNTTNFFTEYNSAVGIKENNLASIPLIYPNPFNNNIYVQSNEVYDISIKDVLGNVVFLEENKNNADLSKLNIGIYFITIKSKNSIYIQKIIKE